ncbi:MAG: release factor glutamine methyltransferase [Patiriisocius sp.]
MTDRVSILDATITAATGLTSSSARLDCQLVLANILNRSRTWLIAHSDELLGHSQYNEYLAHLKQLQRGVPVAYILGQQEFWSLPFRVTDAVLIPRPETELLVEQVLALHPAHPIEIADLGTGTGAIAISLALEKPEDSVYAIDNSIAAIRVAAANRSELGATNVRLFAGSWLAAFAPASLDLIVSNPPYIAANDPHLPALTFEPTQALVSGSDGLDDIRLLVTQGLVHLKPGGRIAIEHGFDQQPRIIDLMLDAGYRNIVGIEDLSSQPRLILAERP